MTHNRDTKSDTSQKDKFGKLIGTLRLGVSTHGAADVDESASWTAEAKREVEAKLPRDLIVASLTGRIPAGQENQLADNLTTIFLNELASILPTLPANLTKKEWLEAGIAATQAPPPPVPPATVATHPPLVQAFARYCRCFIHPPRPVATPGALLNPDDLDYLPGCAADRGLPRTRVVFPVPGPIQELNSDVLWDNLLIAINQSKKGHAAQRYNLDNDEKGTPGHKIKTLFDAARTKTQPRAVYPALMTSYERSHKANLDQLENAWRALVKAGTSTSGDLTQETIDNVFDLPEEIINKMGMDFKSDQLTGAVIPVLLAEYNFIPPAPGGVRRLVVTPPTALPLPAGVATVTPAEIKEVLSVMGGRAIGEGTTYDLSSQKMGLIASHTANVFFDPAVPITAALQRDLEFADFIIKTNTQMIIKLAKETQPHEPTQDQIKIAVERTTREIIQQAIAHGKEAALSRENLNAAMNTGITAARTLPLPAAPVLHGSLTRFRDIIVNNGAGMNRPRAGTDGYPFPPHGPGSLEEYNKKKADQEKRYRDEVEYAQSQALKEVEEDVPKNISRGRITRYQTRGTMSSTTIRLGHIPGTPVNEGLEPQKFLLDNGLIIDLTKKGVIAEFPYTGNRYQHMAEAMQRFFSSKAFGKELGVDLKVELGEDAYNAYIIASNSRPQRYVKFSNSWSDIEKTWSRAHGSFETFKENVEKLERSVKELEEKDTEHFAPKPRSRL